MELEHVLDRAKVWCAPGLVPTEHRAPARLQGLFWIKRSTLPLPAVAVCFSRGMWHKGSRTLELDLTRDVLFTDASLPTGTLTTLVGVVYKTKAILKVQFDDNFDTGKVFLSSAGVLSRLSGALKLLFDFDFKDSGQGWTTDLSMNVPTTRLNLGGSGLVRVLDGELNVDDQEARDMMRHLTTRFDRDLFLKSKVYHYSDKIDNVCVDDMEYKGTTRCEDGMFLVTSGSPTFGFLHMVPAEGSFNFARATLGEDCSMDYTISCDRGVVAVTETEDCKHGTDGSSKIHNVYGRLGKVLTDWTVCAQPKKGLRLHLTTEAVDLVWDAPLGGSARPFEVNGCLHVSRKQNFEKLQNMSDSEVKKQIQFVREVKRNLNGCPTFHNKAGRDERAADFEGAWKNNWMKELQGLDAKQAACWAQRGHVLGAPDGQAQQRKVAECVDRKADFLSRFTEAMQSNYTAMFLAFAQANCGESTPYYMGPQVFRHDEVAKIVGSPEQPRKFYVGRSQQIHRDECFQPTSLLFQSADSAEHTQARMLLDKFVFRQDGLEEFHASVRELGEKKAPAITRDAAPDAIQVGRRVLPLLMRAMWDKTPDDSTVEAILPYLQSGKMCAFGLVSKPSQAQVIGVEKARDAMVQFAQSSRMGQRLVAEAMDEDTEDFPMVQQLYRNHGKESVEEPSSRRLLRDVADAALLFGLAGTSDMARKCVQYQLRDPEHVRLFRKDRTAYLQELMRYDPAVPSFTTFYDAEETDWMMNGEKVLFDQNTQVQMVLASANRDRRVFDDPETFDPERIDLGKQLSWNGLLDHVKERDSTTAPRFCPGYEVSLEIAKAVCNHFTKGLPAWGSEPKFARVDFNSGKGMLDYQLATSIRGLWGFGLTTSGERMEISGGPQLVEKVSTIDRRGPYEPVDVEQESEPEPVNLLAGFAERHARILSNALFWDQDVSAFAVGPYAAGEYGVASLWLQDEPPLRADAVAVPTHFGKSGKITLGEEKGILCPAGDVDFILGHKGTAFGEPFFAPEAFSSPLLKDALNSLSVLKPGLISFFGVQGALRYTAGGSDVASWEQRLGSTHARKKDFLMSWYSTVGKTKQGAPRWPTEEVDFSSRRFTSDGDWEDKLERTMAFMHIGTHRVEVLESTTSDGAQYILPLNDVWRSRAVRPGFGLYGGDMYFDEQGMPLKIVMHQKDGEDFEVQKGEEGWQHWKFVWRSTLLTTVFLADHLYTAHFDVACKLADAARSTLLPDHPIRRLLTPFTFRSIYACQKIMHTMLGPDHMLHRASSLENLDNLADLARDSTASFNRFSDASLLDELPEQLRSAPYYTGGRRIYGALHKLVLQFFQLYSNDLCGRVSGTITDEELIRFSQKFPVEVQPSEKAAVKCSKLADDLAHALFTVTAWHRHVSAIGDYYSDPDLASMSWNEATKDTFPQPQRHAILSMVVALMSEPQLKLNGDFTHVFAGIHEAERAKTIWQRFRVQLDKAEDAISRRNLGRRRRNQIESVRFLPSRIEISPAA
uniref:Lipoxygenase domain-containing protein n=1 Tax=Zooxanthella nutricula TaxID=1333877 RepID=A0A7S2VN71_9DINO